MEPKNVLDVTSLESGQVKPPQLRKVYKYLGVGMILSNGVREAWLWEQPFGLYLIDTKPTPDGRPPRVTPIGDDPGPWFDTPEAAVRHAIEAAEKEHAEHVAGMRKMLGVVTNAVPATGTTTLASGRGVGQVGDQDAPGDLTAANPNGAPGGFSSLP